jgi:hypothetical protein
MDLGGWLVKHNKITYKIPDNLKLKPNSKLKIWSSDYANYAVSNDLVNNNVKTWGGETDTVITILLDPYGKEKAKFSQKTITEKPFNHS